MGGSVEHAREQAEEDHPLLVGVVDEFRAHKEEVAADFRRLEFFLAYNDFTRWGDTWEWGGDPDGSTGLTWREAVDLAMAHHEQESKR